MTNQRLVLDLAVTDLDSIDKELILVITYASQRGQLRYDDGSPTGTYLSVGDFFTMDDLFYNRIIYERNAGKLNFVISPLYRHLTPVLAPLKSKIASLIQY